MQYKGFIIQKTHYNHYEITVAQPLRDLITKDWPFSSPTGVKETKEEAMTFIDDQIAEAEKMLKQIKEVKQLTKGFPK